MTELNYQELNETLCSILKQAVEKDQPSWLKHRSRADVKTVAESIVGIVHKLNKRLEQKSSSVFISSHEILGIVSEEFREFEDEVKKNDQVGIREELIDIAVGCIWGLVSIETGVDW